MAGTDLATAIAAAHEAVDELLTAPLDLSTDDELLDFWRDLERLARRLPAVEHRLVNEAKARALPGQYGCRTTVQFLRGLLRIDSYEAKARAAGAEAAGPRTALIGEPLSPIYAQVAAAQQAGEISPRHAALVVKTIEGLPEVVQAEHPELESELVEHARRFDPAQCAKLAHRITAYLHPDGILEDLAHRERGRGFELRRRPDGSGHFAGEATAELAERLQVLFDALAAPKKETDGVKDPRTATQQRHDAVLNLLIPFLPSAGGVAATIVLTMTQVSGAGTVRQQRNRRTRLGGDDNREGPGRRASITHYSDTQRCFTEQQRLALIARDGGCSFPGCDTPPGLYQAHHLIPWQDSRRTSVDNGTLVCGYHHREHERNRALERQATAQPRVDAGRRRQQRRFGEADQPRFNDVHQT